MKSTVYLRRVLSRQLAEPDSYMPRYVSTIEARERRRCTG
jgi:hypothetical protein